MNYDAEINLARQVLSKTPDKWPTRSEIARMARALLSTSSAERAMREALEKISGHKDLRILQSVYYRETAEQIAARL
jgi:hypothetical protein